MTVYFIGKSHFSGEGSVYNRDNGKDPSLSAILRTMASQLALYAAGAVSDLTDSSGGSSTDGTLAAIPSFTPTALIAAVAAAGDITIGTNPANNDTVTINGTVVTFVTSGASGNQVNLGGTAALTATALYTFLNGSADTQISKLTWTNPSSGVVHGVDKTAGAAGNSYTLATSVPAKITVPATLSGGADANLVSKTSLESAFGTVRDALSELIAQCNNVIAQVPAFSTLTDSSGGASADGTIGAITTSFSGTGSSLASANGANAVVAALKNEISQVAVYVNKLLVACGASALTDSTGGTKSYSSTIASVSTGTGSTVSGADATTANGGVTVTQAAATLTAMLDSVHEMAHALNAITGTVTLGTAKVIVR